MLQRKDPAQFKTKNPGAFVITETRAKWNTGEREIPNEFEVCKSNREV